MASKRMCPQSVVLYNYVGEVNRRASYAITILHNVRNIVYRGAASSGQGRGEADTSKLYIFDDILFATNEKGEEVQYKPYEEWVKLIDKGKYWTLSPDGDDFYYDIDNDTPTISGSATAGAAIAGEGNVSTYYGKKFKVKGFKRLNVGSPRLAHFEVDGG